MALTPLWVAASGNYGRSGTVLTGRMPFESAVRLLGLVDPQAAAAEIELRRVGRYEAGNLLLVRLPQPLIAERSSL